MINIRDLTLLCGDCGRPLTLSEFSRREESSVYTYVCENRDCSYRGRSTLLELSRELDEFSHRPEAETPGDPL
jgi:hypothetical protein